MNNLVINSTAMLNYAGEVGEAGEAGDGNTAAFMAADAAKMTRAVR